MKPTILIFCLLALNAPLLSAQNEAVYSSKEFLNRYGERIPAPAFSPTMDLSSLSLEDLRHLRALPLARKGYLFREADIRAWFQGKDWYQPVWWDARMDFRLTREEEDFVARVDRRIEELRTRNFVTRNAIRVPHLANAINLSQFDSIPRPLLEKLEVHGFAIVPGQDEQLFHVYEENDYQLTPNFVTTDVFLQLFHMYFDFLLRRIEEQRLVPALDAFSRALVSGATPALTGSGSPLVKRAAARVVVHAAVAATLLGKGKAPKVPPALASVVKTEVARVKAANARGSDFLDNELFDYTAFIPRGHYTRSEALKRYFRAMLWMQRAPLYLDSEEGLVATALMASIVKSQPKIRDLYTSIAEPLTFIAGAPDNLSLVEAMSQLDGTTVVEKELPLYRYRLLAKDPERIKAKGSDALVEKMVARPRLLVFAQRYSPDAEVLQRSVHVKRDPKPLRPFPKGLDVFAALGWTAATDILLTEIKEAESWPAFPDTLGVLRTTFASYPSWEANIYNLWLSGIAGLRIIDDRAQPVMHTPAWQKRCLNTALAAWTGLKHDFALYSKQAEVAECGGEEPPPPPVTVGYVEPALPFWIRSEQLMEKTRELLTRFGWWTGDVKAVSTAIRETAGFLRLISEKELRNERLKDKEYETIRLMGSTIDQLTRQVMGVVDWGTVVGPDRSIALVTDVFTNGDLCLQEAVGLGNSLYVLVEIDGWITLTRGAVYSTYEFIQPTQERLTDERWQQRIEEGDLPDLPNWIREILAPVKPLEPAEGSSYSSGC